MTIKIYEEQQLPSEEDRSRGHCHFSLA